MTCQFSGTGNPFVNKKVLTYCNLQISHMQSDERKKQILSVALKAFWKYGYENTSIAIICEHSGIARGTLYQYFSCKQSLFQELIQEFIQRIKEIMIPYDFLGSPSLPYGEFQFNRLLKALKEVSENKEGYGILLSEAMTKNSKTDVLVKKFYSDLIDFLSIEFTNGIHAGRLALSNPEFVSACIQGTLLMIIQRYIILTDDPVAPDLLARQIISLYEDGFYREK